MKNFIEAVQYAFAALGGAVGAVMGGFDGFLYALIVFVVVDYLTERIWQIGTGTERQQLLWHEKVALREYLGWFRLGRYFHLHQENAGI